jgi:hypothetical protein
MSGKTQGFCIERREEATKAIELKEMSQNKIQQLFRLP